MFSFGSQNDSKQYHSTQVLKDRRDQIHSPGRLDNNPEQIRNKLKISAYVLETTEKNISKVL